MAGVFLDAMLIMTLLTNCVTVTAFLQYMKAAIQKNLGKGLQKDIAQKFLYDKQSKLWFHYN